MSNFYDDDEMYDEGEYAIKKCDFCGQVVEWTEPVDDIDKQGNKIELRSCLMCSFEGVYSPEEIKAVMDQMKKHK